MPLRTDAGTAALYPRLRQQVQARPDALAVEDDERRWSYREFDAEIARWMREPLGGLAPGSAYGWLGHNAVAMLAALFACARLGLRLVPLNWRLAAPELRAIAGHAQLAGWHADAGLDALDGLAPQRGAPDDARPGDLLLAYTSGTTGEPKGALHTQAAMAANLDAAIEAQRFDAATRTLAVLPLFHMGGLAIQLLPTLAAGGAVRLHARFDPGAWFDDVARWRPSTSLLVPAVMRALVEHPRWPQADLSALAFVAAGSSIVPTALINAFHARGVPVAQVYGATETGPVTLVLPPHEALAHVGSVGRPARGVEVRIEAGELWVRAANLARGYHRRPHDPAFADGWFRSGDLARRGDDGRYEIVGRSKELIISGGENILPAELEQVALEDPAVAEAVALGLPDARWGEVPVLALVARPGATVDVERLRATLATRLARFKQPRRIVLLDALPKTALGKVARAALLAALAAAGDDRAHHA